VRTASLPARPAAVVFDLDGTLVDSVPDIASSTNHALGEYGIPARSEDDVRRWIGNGARRLMARAVTDDMHGEPDGDLLERALASFVSHYTIHACVRSSVYPGTTDTLATLHGCGARLACVTNKPAEPARGLLAQLGLDTWFELVVGGDTLARAKPDPMPLRHALEVLAASPGSSVMVGDSVNDVLTARAAGVAVICTSYGYNHGRDIREAQPDAVVDSLAEIPALLALAAG